MHSNQSNRSKWLFRERLAASRGLTKGISPDKSSESISRRLNKNEGDKLELVQRIRRMWAAGISKRKIQAIVGFDPWQIIRNANYYDESYDPSYRVKR